jgi:hypothetical protein
VSRSGPRSYMLGVMRQPPSYMLTGVSKRTVTLGTRASNALEAIRIANDWRKRGIADIKIEDDEGRSYDPEMFEKIHAHRT